MKVLALFLLIRTSCFVDARSHRRVASSISIEIIVSGIVPPLMDPHPSVIAFAFAILVDWLVHYEIDGNLRTTCERLGSDVYPDTLKSSSSP